jgi:two-component system, cell cycle sensor histidine kinase and response regulator CckA
VKCKTDSLDTLETFRSNPQGYDLVITDMTMPRMTGEELGKEIMRIRPGMPIILCTGFSERMPEDKALELGFCAFAMKPVVIEEIAQKIRQALDGKRR